MFSTGLVLCEDCIWRAPPVLIGVYVFPESAEQRQTDLYPAYRTEDAVTLPQERELTLRDLLQMFRRRRAIVYAAAGVIVLRWEFVVRPQYTPLPGNGNHPGAKGKLRRA
jgi:hypothetical protein